MTESPLRARARDAGWRFPLAVALAAVSVACCVAAVPLHAWVGSDRSPQALASSDLVLATVWPVVGALVVRVAPRNAVGWLMLVPSLLGPYQVAGLYAAHTDGAGALGTFCAWLAVWGFAPYFFTAPVLPHLFPDGRPHGRGWALVLRATLVVAAVTTLARMFATVDADLAPGVVNPAAPAWGEVLNYVTGAGSGALFFVGLPLAVASLLVRLRGANGVERTQLQWLLLGGLVLLGGVFVGIPGAVGPVDGFALGLVGPPAAIAVAMYRHRLFDVEVTLNRTLVLGLLTGLVVVAYVLVVYVAQAVVPGSRLGVLLVAVAALVAAALRDRAQQVVDRWLFGHRHNAYAVVARVGREVAAASQPVEALQRLVEGLREALRLPYVAFTSGDLSTASGVPVHGSRVVPVTALGESVGELHVGLRSPHERWTTQQEAAVEEVAARAGTLAYAAALVTDIAVSRGRIVAAREEERRRLRADLHDGVAPALAGAALQLDSLRRRLARLDPDLADRADAVRDSIRSGVSELRAVVHGLRPPVLDQLGLAGALRQLVAGHDAPAGRAVVELTGELDAAVEVAAYAIAAEAYSNAMRHGVATTVTLTARDEGELVVLDIVDDGVGLPPRPREGVGMLSMRERAALVGGRLDVTATPGGGTTVRAALPRRVA